MGGGEGGALTTQFNLGILKLDEPPPPPPLPPPLPESGMIALPFGTTVFFIY